MQRRYRRTVGLSAAQVEQLRRAERGYALLHAGRTPAEAAVEAGFSDQAHFTRALRLIRGRTPAAILSAERARGTSRSFAAGAGARRWDRERTGPTVVFVQAPERADGMEWRQRKEPAMAIPTGYSTINPFIVTDDVRSYLQFVSEVFDAVEHTEAHTVDDDGLVLHAELRIGDGSILLADRKPDWPVTPSLLQIYVDDVAATLARAVERGAVVITEPTDFFGSVFSRIIDPWGNGWWVYSTPGDGDADWGAGDSAEWASDDESSEWGADVAWEKTPELTYIHETMLTMFRRLGEGVSRRRSGSSAP